MCVLCECVKSLTAIMLLVGVFNSTQTPLSKIVQCLDCAVDNVIAVIKFHWMTFCLFFWQ